MNQSLVRLYQNQTISLEDARRNSTDIEEFTSLLVHSNAQGNRKR